MARGIFAECPENEIFRGKCGRMVLAGAFAVDKFKVVDGVDVHQLRFISNFVPLNSYMRALNGDSELLPQAALLCNLVLGDDEFFLSNGEDLQSCFNLFSVPDAWLGFFAYEKKVSRSLFGGPADELTYVSIRSCPMGWTASVDLIQNFIRQNRNRKIVDFDENSIFS